MATRVELFTVTTPPGVTQSAPQVTLTTFDIGELEAIEVLVPPGNAGLSGFAIMHSNASVFPREDSKWITAVGEVLKWTTQDMPTSGRWGIRSYNADVNPHSIYLRYLVRDDGPASSTPIAALPITQPNQESPSTEETPSPIEEIAAP